MEHPIVTMEFSSLTVALCRVLYANVLFDGVSWRAKHCDSRVLASRRATVIHTGRLAGTDLSSRFVTKGHW